MPLVNVRVIEGVFTAEQKREMIRRITDTMVGIGRSQLAAELFSDADDPLGALRWCMADLRRCLGRPDWLRGDAPVIAADGAWVDVWALRNGALPPAEIGGLLLDGVEPRDCPRFDVWLLLARGECAARSMQELRQAALRLLAAGDAEAAVTPAGRAAGLAC
jgi:hypothetical protein